MEVWKWNLKRWKIHRYCFSRLRNGRRLSVNIDVPETCGVLDIRHEEGITSLLRYIFVCSIDDNEIMHLHVLMCVFSNEWFTLDGSSQTANEQRWHHRISKFKHRFADFMYRLFRKYINFFRMENVTRFGLTFGCILRNILIFKSASIIFNRSILCSLWKKIKLLWEMHFCQIEWTALVTAWKWF